MRLHRNDKPIFYLFMMNDTVPLKIVGLILAGGKSRRMGQDKALIPWDGTPLLKRVAHTAKTCCHDVYIITPWTEKYQPMLEENYRFLTEYPTGEGALVAFSQGLLQISQNSDIKALDWVLLLACDLPKLQVNILQQWIQNLENIPQEVLAVVPKQEVNSQDFYWESLCAFYRPAMLSQLLKFIEKGGRSFQTFLETIPVQPLTLNSVSQEMLLNCNTPQDLV